MGLSRGICKLCVKSGKTKSYYWTPPPYFVYICWSAIDTFIYLLCTSLDEMPWYDGQEMLENVMLEWDVNGESLE